MGKIPVMTECLKLENLSDIFQGVDSLFIEKVNITYEMNDIDGMIKIDTDRNISGTQIRKTQLTPYSIIAVIDSVKKSWCNFHVFEINYVQGEK